MRRALLLLLFGCRHPNETNAALVVTPSAVDGGALVTIPAPPDDHTPEGCPSEAAIAADAKRLAEALHEMFEVEWSTRIEDGRITASPVYSFEEGSRTAFHVFDTVHSAFPDLVLGEAQVSGHRTSIFTCRGELPKAGVDPRTRHAVCLETNAQVVVAVRVDRSRRLPAFAPLFVVTEEEAPVLAVEHVLATTKGEKIGEPHAGRPQLVAECDDRRRATLLQWVVDVEVGWGIVTVGVDARTKTRVETKVQPV